MNNEKFEEASKYEKEIEEIAFSYLEKGRNFDVVHTEYGLEVLQEHREELEEDIYKILHISFALHDIGYSLLDEAPEGYEDIRKQKQAHAILGSQEAKEILSNNPDILNEEEVATILHLILHHDEVEEIVNYEYNGFEIGRFLMSLDTLGAFIAIKNGEATFTQEELKKYIEKGIERRGSRVHKILKPLFEETLSEINENLELF